ncbi:MAG: transposase [Defluviitaleaceae bacterium]|nr:transposase [Defluviitaleaceae bacterium]
MIPQEMKKSLQELKINAFLRESNIKKAKGTTIFEVFTTIFLLSFQKETWFQQKFMSDKSDSLVGKDVVYRFLNRATYNWKKFLLLLSSHLIGLCSRLTSNERVKVLVLDDTLFSKARSKSVELLSTVFDHTTRKYVKGFQCLVLGWTDGASFVPVNFSLMASVKHLIKGINEDIDKRTSGYKRRLEATASKPIIAAKLIEEALANGISASYVLMDTWFTEAPLIKSILTQGLDVIGMVKRGPKRLYDYKGKKYTAERLLKLVNRNTHSSEIIGSIHVKMNSGIPVKLVFIKHRNNPKKWLVLLSTDQSLSDEEIVRIYGYRWNIEIFFKCNKSHLNLSSEFQCRSYDSLIAHTSIVFSRYIFLAWEQRKANDDKTLGYLFFEFGEDIREVDFTEALLALMNFILDIVMNQQEEVIIKVADFKNAVLTWISTLPKYLQRFLGVLIPVD